MSPSVQTLFLSYDGLTDPLGQSQILPYLEGLSKEGYGIHIISFEKKERWEQLGEKINGACKEKCISWHPLVYHKSPPVLSTLYDLYRMRRKAEALHAKYSFQLIHARSYPPALVALRLKNRLGIPYIFDIRGFWPEERVEGGIWNLANPIFRAIYSYFKKKEISLYKEAAAIITLTHKAKEILLARPELQPIPDITVIPCCADMNHFDPKRIKAEDIFAIRKKLLLTSADYVLCYVGSIGTWYMLEEMFQFFLVLKVVQPKVKFLLITRDTQEHILRVAKQEGVQAEDLRIVSATYAEVPAYIAAAQSTVFFIRPSFSKQASSPTKQAELMSMGKSIVTNAGVGDADEILQQTKGGVLMQEFSQSAYHKAANQLLDLTLDVGEVRKRTEEIYSLAIGIERYDKVYFSVLQGKLNRG